MITNCSNSLATSAYAVFNRLNYPLVNEVFEMQENELYHKKVIRIDDRWTCVGSYNFTKKSHHFDDEIMIVIHSQRVAQVVDQVLNQDCKLATQVPAEVPLSSTMANFFFNSFSELL